MINRMFEYDLTGSLPEYHSPAEQYTIGTSDTGEWVLDLNRPVFVNSIVVKLLGIGGSTPLEKDVDWWVTEVDQTSMAKAYSMDASFRETLARKITIKSGVERQIVTVEYQSLLPIKAGDFLVSGDAVELTPALLIEMYNRLITVESLTKAMVSEIAPTSAHAKLLDEDRTMVLERNYIKGEVHSIDSFSNVRLIRPACGAFFPDDFILRRVGYPNVMVHGHDYEFFGIDVARTRITPNKNGVFRYIRVLEEFIGDVEISYRGYGGEVAYDDVVIINDRVTDILSYLSGNSFVNERNLTEMRPFKLLQNKINEVEEKMRILVEDGVASYGDKTDGKAVKHVLKATKVGLNWFTIGKLHKVVGSDDVITADQMKFRFTLRNANVMGDVACSLNLLSPNPFSVDAINYNTPLGYVKFEDYSGLADIARVQFRAIWNKTTGTMSGAYLQIGIYMHSLTETMGIEDHSGVQSSWLLLDATESGTLPDNTAVTLPNSSYIWDITNNSSLHPTELLYPSEGWLAHAGSTTSTEMGAGEPVHFVSTIPNTYPLQTVKNIRLEFGGDNGVFTATGTYDAATKLAWVFVTTPDDRHLSIRLDLDTNESTITIFGTFVGNFSSDTTLTHIYFTD